MPQPQKRKKFKTARHAYGQFVGSRVIELQNVNDSKRVILTHQEHRDFLGWLKRGRELVNRITEPFMFPDEPTSEEEE